MFGRVPWRYHRINPLSYPLYIYIIDPLFSHSHSRSEIPNNIISVALCVEMRSLGTEKTTIGWAARDPSGALSPHTYTLR